MDGAISTVQDKIQRKKTGSYGNSGEKIMVKYWSGDQGVGLHMDMRILKEERIKPIIVRITGYFGGKSLKQTGAEVKVDKDFS